jgi:hypothetical protein
MLYRTKQVGALDMEGISKATINVTIHSLITRIISPILLRHRFFLVERLTATRVCQG